MERSRFGEPPKGSKAPPAEDRPPNAPDPAPDDEPLTLRRTADPDDLDLPADERPWILAFGVAAAAVVAAVVVAPLLSRRSAPPPSLAMEAVSPRPLAAQPEAVTEAAPPEAPVAPAAPETASPPSEPSATARTMTDTAGPPPALAPASPVAAAPPQPRPAVSAPPVAAAPAPRSPAVIAAQGSPARPTVEPDRLKGASAAPSAPPAVSGQSPVGAAAGRDLARADRQLRRAYSEAAEAGLSADRLVAAQDTWDRLRAEAASRPDAAAAGYRRLADELTREAAAKEGLPWGETAPSAPAGAAGPG